MRQNEMHPRTPSAEASGVGLRSFETASFILLFFTHAAVPSPD
jgi:hypothetical protein